MTYDNTLEAHVREYLDGAGRALARGDAASTTLEIAQALQYGIALARKRLASDSREYRALCERLCAELARLPPWLVREAARRVEEGPPRPFG